MKLLIYILLLLGTFSYDAFGQSIEEGEFKVFLEKYKTYDCSEKEKHLAYPFTIEQYDLKLNLTNTLKLKNRRGFKCEYVSKNYSYLSKGICSEGFGIDKKMNGKIIRFSYSFFSENIGSYSLIFKLENETFYLIKIVEIGSE